MSLIQKVCQVLRGTCSFLYWNIIRPCIKFFYRKYTGMHEIERAATKDDVRAFYQSILKSKELMRVRIYFEEGVYKDDTLNMAIVEEIYNVKNIYHTKENVELFVKMSNRLFNILKSKQFLEDVRKTKYEHGKEADKAKLIRFWNLMTNNEPITDLITRRWIEIGFQGEDPATDFRGAGMLGLDNLIYFVENHTEKAMETYKGSCTAPHTYFFAAGGLYITLEIYHMINDNYFDEFFYESNSKDKAVMIFSELYSSAFYLFDRYWVKQPNATMMRFNTIITEFFVIMKRDLLGELKRSAEEACKAKNLL